MVGEVARAQRFSGRTPSWPRLRPSLGCFCYNLPCQPGLILVLPKGRSGFGVGHLSGGPLPRARAKMWALRPLQPPRPFMSPESLLQQSLTGLLSFFSPCPLQPIFQAPAIFLEIYLIILYLGSKPFIQN